MKEIYEVILEDENDVLLFESPFSSLELAEDAKKAFEAEARKDGHNYEFRIMKRTILDKVETAGEKQKIDGTFASDEIPSIDSEIILNKAA